MIQIIVLEVTSIYLVRNGLCKYGNRKLLCLLFNVSCAEPPPVANWGQIILTCVTILICFHYSTLRRASFVSY